MAKDAKPKPAAVQPLPDQAPATKPAASDATPVVVRMRRRLICAGKMLEVGDKLATVTLPPGVTLNFLVDAIRNGFAGD